MKKRTNQSVWIGWRIFNGTYRSEVRRLAAQAAAEPKN